MVWVCWNISQVSQQSVGMLKDLMGESIKGAGIFKDLMGESVNSVALLEHIKGVLLKDVDMLELLMGESIKGAGMKEHPTGESLKDANMLEHLIVESVMDASITAPAAPAIESSKPDHFRHERPWSSANETRKSAPKKTGHYCNYSANKSLLMHY